jgi:cytochrome c nitrite reductase small subunit
VAVCNSCHLPEGVVGRYVTKAANGFAHALAFTTGWYPEPLRIKPHNLEVAERACRTCHAAIVAAIDHPPLQGGPMACTRCHGDVGHSR